MKNRIKGTLLPIALAVLIYFFAAEFIGYLCPVRRLTGFSCPGCGITRAYKAFFTGDIRGAFYYHPLFLLPVPAVLIIIFEKKIPSRVYNISLAIIACLFIAVYIIRMLNGSPVIDRDFHQGLIWKAYDTIRKITGNG